MYSTISKNLPLREGKGTEYEGGYRVPMIMSWAGHLKPGTVSHEPVITMDITATMMDLAGSGRADSTDGVSLLPLLEGKRMTERPLFWHYPHYHRGKPFSAVRLGDWKLIEHLEDGSQELYNLRKDIGEQDNLIGRYPEKAAKLEAMLDAWRKDVGAQMLVPNPAYDPEKADKRPAKKNSAASKSAKEELLLDTLSVPYEVYRRNPDLKMYFLYPEDMKKDEKRPAIVFFFGGGWVNGSVQAFAMQGKELAEKGMIAVLADYRTKTRFGTDPVACVEDAKSAMRYVKKNADRLQIDTSRLAAGGGSAGGHLAAATAFVDGFDSPDDDLSVSPVPKALVLFNPVFNNAPVPEGYGYERIKDVFPQFSPYHNIGPEEAPATLVMLGSRDKLIPVPVAEAFAEKVRSTGARCDLEIYDGAGHGFFNYNRRNIAPDFYRQTMDRTEDFLRSLGYLCE